LADPWFGDQALHKQILGQMLDEPEFALQIKAQTDATLKDLPKGSSPFEPL
jgi:hypothetical protein